MATLTYGPIVANARGSIGGTSFGQSTAGHTGRAKAHPPKPSLSTQIKNKSVLAYAAAKWALLPAATRSDWAVYAATLTFTDSLANSYHPTAAAAFIRNTIVQNSMYGFIATLIRPTVDGLPTVPVLTFDYNAHNIRCATVTPDLAADQALMFWIYRLTTRRVTLPAHLFSTIVFTNSMAEPSIIATGIDTGYKAGLIARAHVKWRFYESTRQCSQIQSTYVDFTST